MKVKHSLITFLGFSLLITIGSLSAVGDDYSTAENSSGHNSLWKISNPKLGQSIARNQESRDETQNWTNQISLSSSGHRKNGSLSLADPVNTVIKTTNSDKLQKKEQIRMHRKILSKQRLEARSVRRNLILVRNNPNDNQ